MATDTTLPIYSQGALKTYQGIGGALISNPQLQVDTSGYGSLPNNGCFGWGFSRKFREITDGLSNTLMLGEYVHFDCPNGACEPYPGQIRPRAVVSEGAYANYSFKVVVNIINSPLARVADSIPFNYLAMGSFHPQGAQFAFADGSVQFLVEDMNLLTYQQLSTVSGNEVTNF